MRNSPVHHHSLLPTTANPNTKLAPGLVLWAIVCTICLQIYATSVWQSKNSNVELNCGGGDMTPPSSATTMMPILSTRTIQGSKLRNSTPILQDQTRSISAAAAAATLEPTSFDGVHARAFEPWKDGLPLPCFDPEPKWWLREQQRSPSRDGFLFVKEMKTGGSTAAGIHLRIARNVARRHFPKQRYDICKTRNDHTRATKLDYRYRNKDQSFLWTVLRDPTKRAISQFFHFEVSRAKVEPTDENFRRWIERDFGILDQYYIQTLILKDVPDQVYYEEPATLANQIMQDYDFIGVTERMDETAVVLQLLLNLTTGDILYTNSKSNGGFDDGMSRNGCTYIVPSFLSPGMKDYFANNEVWKNMTYADTLLHRAANRSLDLTIDRLGRARFEKALQKFQYAMKHVESECVPKARFPCSPSGQRTDHMYCHWMDSGCGIECLDKLSLEMGLYDNDNNTIVTSTY